MPDGKMGCPDAYDSGAYARLPVGRRRVDAVGNLGERAQIAACGGARRFEATQSPEGALLVPSRAHRRTTISPKIYRR